LVFFSATFGAVAFLTTVFAGFFSATFWVVFLAVFVVFGVLFELVLVFVFMLKMLMFIRIIIAHVQFGRLLDCGALAIVRVSLYNNLKHYCLGDKKCLRDLWKRV
jgi:hypothetical protein